MSDQSMRDGLLVRRPLLALRRDQLQTYASHHGLQVVHDPSNSDTRLTRNHIRHQVIPALSQLLPGIDSALLRTAGNSAAAMRALQQLLFDGQSPPEALSRLALRDCPSDVAGQAIRFWLRAARLRSPGRARLTHMLAQLRDSDAAYAQIDHDGWCVRRYRDRIWLEKPDAPPLRTPNAGPATQIVWTGQAELPIPGFDGRLLFLPASPDRPSIRRERLQAAPICVTGLRMSARMRMHPQGPTRPLRLLCQEKAIARWSRLRLPMLWLDEQPLYAAGIGMNADFADANPVAGMDSSIPDNPDIPCDAAGPATGHVSLHWEPATAPAD